MKIPSINRLNLSPSSSSSGSSSSSFSSWISKNTSKFMKKISRFSSSRSSSHASSPNSANFQSSSDGSRTTSPETDLKNTSFKSYGIRSPVSKTRNTTSAQDARCSNEVKPPLYDLKQSLKDDSTSKAILGQLQRIQNDSIQKILETIRKDINRLESLGKSSSPSIMDQPLLSMVAAYIRIYQQAEEIFPESGRNAINKAWNDYKTPCSNASNASYKFDFALKNMSNLFKDIFEANEKNPREFREFVSLFKQTPESKENTPRHSTMLFNAPIVRHRNSFRKTFVMAASRNDSESYSLRSFNPDETRSNDLHRDSHSSDALEGKGLGVTSGATRAPLGTAQEGMAEPFATGPSRPGAETSGKSIASESINSDISNIAGFVKTGAISYENHRKFLKQKVDFLRNSTKRRTLQKELPSARKYPFLPMTTHSPTGRDMLKRSPDPNSFLEPASNLPATPPPGRSEVHPGKLRGKPTGSFSGRLSKPSDSEPAENLNPSALTIKEKQIGQQKIRDVFNRHFSDISYEAILQSAKSMKSAVEAVQPGKGMDSVTDSIDQEIGRHGKDWSRGTRLGIRAHAIAVLEELKRSG